MKAVQIMEKDLYVSILFAFFDNTIYHRLCKPIQYTFITLYNGYIDIIESI
jgi:hypothetical protein